MDRTVTIAFDVMGSELGPGEVVRGAVRWVLEAPHLHVLLVGDREEIEAALETTPHNAERIAVQHAAHPNSQPPSDSDSSSDPETSIQVAARLVSAGEADALVSAGDTGNTLRACERHFALL